MQTLDIIKNKFPGILIDACCISAAGPIENNCCKLTNGNWEVNGDKIKKAINIPTIVVNDFIALSSGIPLLDITNKDKIIQIPATDGSYPKPFGKNKAVIGAGTGLGIGFMPFIDGEYQPIASEGGHFDFPAFDDETTKLMKYLRSELGFHPGTERVVSGQGLIWIFDWLKKEKQLKEVIQV